jgi:hypothetical protein
MTTAQKVAGGVVVVMVLTAVLLPGRQTVPVLNATKNLATGVEHTAITGAA